MGVPRFLVQLFRQAPSKRQLLGSLALDNKGGNRQVESPDGTRLSVRQTGDGPPLVLVHGALDGMGAFSLIELRLAERYSVWAFDRRGRGGSGDAADYSLQREVDDLRAIAQATGASPHVLSHSYGAAIALQAAIAGVPMRSLIVYEPPVNGEAISAEKIAEIRAAVDDGRVDDAIRDMATNLAGISDDEMHIAMAVPPVRKRLRSGALVVDRELEALRVCDWSGLPVTGVPTLIMRGGRTVAPAYPTDQQVATLAVDADVAVLDGQGHVGQVFEPTVFADTVLAYLDAH